MKLLTVLAMILALIAGGACGDKNKPEPAKPKPVTADNDTGDDEPDDEPEDTSDDEPESQPDPASLSEVIYFEFDSSELDEDARERLSENHKWLSEDSARTLTIEGHTDESGTNEYNLGLGDRRARAAKDYLVRLGIAASRIKIITYGEERPASSEDAENRRSVFVATRK